MMNHLKIDSKRGSTFVEITLTVIFTVSLWAVALAVQYNVTSLGTLGGYYSGPARITDQGVVVGRSSVFSGGWHAFRWSNNLLEDLGVPDNYLISGATDYNSSGQAVGFANGENQSQYAYFWEGGVWTALGTIGGPGLDYSIASGINDSTQICGYSFSIGPLSGMRAWIWEDEVFSDLGNLSGDKTAANVINNQGQIVGYAQISNPDEYQYHAFFWEDGVMTDLGTLPNEVNSVATDINELNQIAGYSSHLQETYPFNEIPKPCIWNNGEITEIELPQGYVEGVATAINNSGMVVGWMSTDINGPSTDAFIWEGGVLYNLNFLISPNSGWALRTATDINNNGLVVGEGLSPESWIEGYLLTPIVTGVDEDTDLSLPADFMGAVNYPNPFNSSTAISYNLPNSSHVSIEIYDIGGRKVTTLYNGTQSAGKHQVIWNGNNQPSGLYFYRISAGDISTTSKMVLLK